MRINPFLQSPLRLLATRMSKLVERVQLKAATEQAECGPHFPYQGICGAQVQADDKANRPSMRYGRKVRVHRAQ